MTKRVTADSFQESHIICCALNGLLQAGLQYVVPFFMNILSKTLRYRNMIAFNACRWVEADTHSRTARWVKNDSISIFPMK